MKKEEIIESIEKIKDISEKLLKAKEEIKDEELEKYFYKLEKTRMDMYDALRQRNMWLEFMDDKEIEIIDYDYKAKVEDEILKIYIPEKIPSIKREQIIFKNKLHIMFQKLQTNLKECFMINL